MRRAVIFVVVAATVIAPIGCSPDRTGPSTSEDTAQSSSAVAGSRYAAAPYLGELEEDVLFGQIWKRSQLSERDRAMVTVAVTQALYQTDALREYLNRALDAGVTPEEIGELLTHVTMYAGWPSGSNASRVVTDVYRTRGIPFPSASDPISIEIDLRGQTPGYPGLPYLSALTRSVLFDSADGVWSRPGLSPRDRSMVTVAVAEASLASDQLRGHIERALNNGLTPEEIAEVITHVAFYAGWPAGVNAAVIAGEVFEDRNVRVRP